MIKIKGESYKIMIIESRRCFIIDNGDIIKKIYSDQHSFQKECCVYEKMKNKDFIPKLNSIDKSNGIITMEKTSWKNLYQFVDQNKKIPLNLLEELKRIRLEFLNNYFIDLGDFFKLEHIYVSEMDSKGCSRVKVIDFDKVDKVKREDIQKNENWIKDEFERLNTDKEIFKDTFWGLDDTAVNEFFEKKEEQN